MSGTVLTSSPSRGVLWSMGLITQHRSGFALPETVVTDFQSGDFGIRFSVLRLPAHEVLNLETAYETAWLLVKGSLQMACGSIDAAVSRTSLFDELPHTLHVSRGTKVTLTATSEVELCRFEIDNSALFSPRRLGPESVRNELRDKRKLDGTSFRYVRTIIDDVTGPPDAQLVLGEVVNQPGRWSSYPPHHHDQPEIYHYRFTEPQGYGHGEEGETVHKVRNFDTLLIPPGLDHSQCAAPGYGMWYAWAIRHLPGDRYTMPEFAEDHRWLQGDNAKVWRPDDQD